MKHCTLPGFFEGRAIRTARRMHPCDDRGPNCKHVILAGEQYQEGEVDPDRAGGFGLRRHCIRCCPEEIASAENDAGALKRKAAEGATMVARSYARGVLDALA